MKANTPTRQWCVKSGTKDIFWTDSLSYTKATSIAKFLEGSRQTWKYWRTHHGYKCVKVRVVVTPENQ